MWLVVLSDQLRIVGLVGCDPTNNLIRRKALPWLLAHFPDGRYATGRMRS